MSITKIKKLTLALTIIVALLLLSVNLTLAQTSLDSRSIKISNQEVDANPVKYTLGYRLSSAYMIGSIRLQFCQNTPLIGFPCDPIPGFSAASATIINQTGITGYSIAPGATDSSLIFTRVPSIEGPITASIELDNIVNPSNTGTHFARIQTFSSDDATGSSIEEGGATFVTNDKINATAYVPPYLSFCAAATIPGFNCSVTGGTFVDMGELSPYNANYATSQFIGQTNADNGFVVYISGQPPTSGSNVINPLATRQVSIPGSTQFGINLRNNSKPNVGSNPVGAGTGGNLSEYNVPNQFKYVSGDPIYSTNTTTLGNKVTVSYLVNVSANQAPGLYNTTLIFITVASF